MSKQIKFASKAQKLLIKGIRKLYDVVKVTIGPMGNNIMLDTHFTPLVINDGYTIAKTFTLENRYEHMGAMLAIEVARNTNDFVGDGTTSAIILASEMIFEAYHYLHWGTSPILLKQAILELKEIINNIIQKNSKKVTNYDELEKVATISAKNEEIGKMIRQIYEELQTNVAIIIEEGLENELKYVIQKGIVIERGYLSSFMITDYILKKTVLHNANIVIVGDKYELAKILNLSNQPTLFIFNNISSEDLHVLNKFIVDTNEQFVAIRKDEYDEKLDDIRILCDMENIDGYLVGYAKEIVVTKNRTTILNNKNNDKYVNHLIEELKGMDDYHKLITKQRIASLSGGVAKIIVGANTEIELQEIKTHVEDAINACENAYLYGVSLGEGLGYLQIIDSLNELTFTGYHKKAVKILVNALKKPYQHILKNANIKYKMYQPYDFNKHKFVDRDTFNVYDPTKVLETVINNAISVLCMFIVTNVVIADNSDAPKSIDI